MSALTPMGRLSGHSEIDALCPIGDMLAKARIRANAHWEAQWSFVCVRKSAVGGDPFVGGPRQTTAIVATAARAAPIARRRLRLPMPIVRILLVLLALASPLSM